MERKRKKDEGEAEKEQSEKVADKRAAKIREEMEDRLERLRYQYERELNNFRYEIQERDYRLKAYEDKFNKIKEPPLLYAYVVRKGGEDLSGNQVVVARASEMLKVSVGFIDKDGLDIGQYVWVHPQTYAIVEESQEVHKGIVGKVQEVQETNLVVSMEGDLEKRIIKCDVETAKTIKPGYQVSILPPTMEILQVMPDAEVKSLLLGEKPNVTYDRIGGLDEAIERIKDVVVLPFQEKKLFKKIDLKAPRGILLYGPPGCGKTLLVRAIATENNMTFFNISVADILSKWVGESERITKEIFRQARDKKPSIVFFDEIEALFTTRGLLDTSGVHKNIIAQILSEMDGLIEMEDVFVIGATNRPDLLDPALMRPGRFDEIIEIPRPERDAGEMILRIYLKKGLPIEKSFVDKHGGYDEAHQKLLFYVLEELYAQDRWVKMKVDAEAKESVKTVKRRDIVSGAIIEAIVKTAKKNFVKRAIEMPAKKRSAAGLSKEDLRLAIEEECKEHAITEIYIYEKRQREVRRQNGTDPMVG
ncbi:MAG: AAA family ATPase [Thermoplasmata archaeon]